MDEMINIQEELEKILKKKRYQHTLGVRYTAQAMAMCFGEDIKKAGYAGLLHDFSEYIARLCPEALLQRSRPLLTFFESHLN